MSFAQFILGTVVVGVFGTIINSQIQTREVEIKEQENISKNLGTVLSTNSADKLLMAQFYAAVTRSDEIRKRWEIYREELKKEIEAAKARLEIASKIQPGTDAKEMDQKQATIQQIEANITPGAKPTAPESLPARIYFHIQNDAQREKASSIANQLAKDSGAIVPGIETIEKYRGSNEIRYFKLADAVDAERYAEVLKGLGLDLSATYVRGFESSARLRPRHYEVWISSSWK